ncbi:MAG TPA: hypothetical protein VME67_06160 [Mycobacterium sp.]|nr:hypothetical protein [Mycobacterium sp.]HTX94451.1 hypothetical protein [Mycobacterium sp.]
MRLTVPGHDDQDWLKTVGQAWGLARLSEGKSATKAIAEAPSRDALFLSGIQSVYDDLNAGKPNGDEPAADACNNARTVLGDVKVKRKFRFNR